MNRTQDSTLFLISPKKNILVACKRTYFITILWGKLGTKYKICIDFGRGSGTNALGCRDRFPLNFWQIFKLYSNQAGQIDLTR